jgi:hypothetical protein
LPGGVVTRTTDGACRVAGFSLPPIYSAVSAVGGYLQTLWILAINKAVIIIIEPIVTDFRQRIVFRYAQLITRVADKKSRSADTGESSIA